MWGGLLDWQAGGWLRGCLQGSGGMAAGMGGQGGVEHGAVSLLLGLLLVWICAVQLWEAQPAKQTL